jgi:hypothetical protein
MKALGFYKGNALFYLGGLKLDKVQLATGGSGGGGTRGSGAAGLAGASCSGICLIGKVDELDEGPANVQGDVADKVALMGEKDARGVAAFWGRSAWDV